MLNVVYAHIGQSKLYNYAKAQTIPPVKNAFLQIKNKTRDIMFTKPLIEQHFHGAFGINFNNATVEEILYLSKEMQRNGVGGIYPTLVTDSIPNIQAAIAKIKEAAKRQTRGMAKIFGIHLEGIFLNPEKKGIHNPRHFMDLTPENFKLVEDDFIKIVTLAPELDKGLIGYLNNKGIKVQAGHCIGSDLSGCSGVTHMYNAMKGVSHKESSTALSALVNDNVYTEVIGDGVHVSDDCLKLLFRMKPEDKVLLVSDCLPCTKSGMKEFIFADEEVFYDGSRAASRGGTLAGSTTLLPDIIKRLNKIGLFNPKYIENPYNYHNVDLPGSIEWDANYNIVDVKI